MKGLSRSALSVAVAGLVLAVGGAYALGSSLATGQITVCVSHIGGALYQAKTCKAHDKTAELEQAGATRSAGTAGITAKS
jgi:hypothetical protein